MPVQIVCCSIDVLHTNLFHVVLRLVVPSPCLIQTLCLVQLLHHILPVLLQCLNSLTMVLYLALQGVYLRFFPVDLPQNNTMHMAAFYMSPTPHELSLSAFSPYRAGHTLEATVIAMLYKQAPQLQASCWSHLQRGVPC